MSQAEQVDAGTQRVVACVINRGEEFLICQRPAHKRHGGLWEFPGGKVETGELDEEAARRELREELGVELIAASATLFELADPDSHFVIAFVPVTISGTPVCIEHSNLAWGRPTALRERALAPSDRAFVDSLISQSSMGPRA